MWFFRIQFPLERLILELLLWDKRKRRESKQIPSFGDTSPTTHNPIPIVKYVNQQKTFRAHHVEITSMRQNLALHEMGHNPTPYTSILKSEK